MSWPRRPARKSWTIRFNLRSMPTRSFQSGTMHPEEICRQLGNEARAWAHRLGLRGLADSLSLCWHPRLRTTAGLACMRRSRILLNPRLLAFPEELARTFLHEMAHLVAHARHPRRRIAPHGREWKQACCDLGLAGEKRCHILPLAQPRRVARHHFYHCPHCLAEVARVRPFRRGEACLRCCRAHSRGRYDSRFRLVPGHRPETPQASLVQTELFRL